MVHRPGEITRVKQTFDQTEESTKQHFQVLVSKGYRASKTGSKGIAKGLHFVALKAA